MCAHCTRVIANIANRLPNNANLLISIICSLICVICDYSCKILFMETNTREGRDHLLPASILVAAILISGSIIYLVRSGNVRSEPNPAADNGQVQIGGAQKTSDRDVVLGEADAPVTLIEYGDYQCPFCGRFFTDTEPGLREEYIKTGKVKMAFRNFQFLGPESIAAAEAAECAKDQGKFWNYHDALFRAEVADGVESNGNLSRELFLKLAKELSLDTPAFTACFDSGKYKSLIENDLTDAQKYGVDSTPTTFINGQLIQGAQPYAQFKTLIDNLLAGR